MAHRGDHRATTENTMEAFQAAIDLGYRYLESDCQVSADGIAVMAHDPDLRRIAGRPERIDQISWSQLSGVELLRGGRLTRLDEVLHAFPEVHLNLDAKVPGVIEPMARALRGHETRVCVGSFSGRSVARLRALLPHAAHSASPGEVLRLWLGGVRGFTADAAMIPIAAGPIPVATRQLISRAQRHGRQVHVWTVDASEQMEDLLARGVDGLMTDQPHTLKEVLIQKGLW